MAASVTVQSVVVRDGKFYIRFTDGLEIVRTLQDLRDEFVVPYDTRDVCIAVLMAWWLARSPDGSNTNLITGKTGEWDLSKQNIFTVR